MQKLWDKYVVPPLIGFCCTQPDVMKERAKTVPRSDGDVLELGCGGGNNLSFYDFEKVTSLSGIDPSPELMERAQSGLQSRGVIADFRQGFGEDMPFSDNQFDTVLTTFTMCSVQDTKQVLSEIGRVLRPGGKILFLEHGRAPDAGPARWQQRIEPVWKRIAGGCHLHRPVGQFFQNEGLTLYDEGGHYAPKTPRWLGWIEHGEARFN